MNKMLRIVLILAAVFALPQNAIPEQAWTGWQSWMFGQPCSLKIDIIEGTCNIKLRKIAWND